MERAKDGHERKFYHVNWYLLPLKLIIFLSTCAVYSIVPYLSIHMTDIGMTVDQVAIVYAILPFTVFLAPPAVGIVADKLGNFRRALIFVLFGGGIFHTLLLAVPKVEISTRNPLNGAQLNLTKDQMSLLWSHGCRQPHQGLDKVISSPPFNLTLLECNLDCQFIAGACKRVNRMFNCVQDDNKVTFTNVTMTITNVSSYGEGYLTFGGKQRLEMAPGCQLSCNVGNDIPAIIEGCTETSGNVTLIVTLYIILRALATMSVACGSVLIDAQMIQMCKEEEERGNKGAIGQQLVFQALAQAITSPIVGQLMDLVSNKETGEPNYLVSFLASDLFIGITIILLICSKIEISLPDFSGMKGVKRIFTSVDIVVFLVLMFVLGTLFGFVETFLFVYLKKDFGAPMYLLGLTITTGALVAIPFLYITDFLVDKIGIKNSFILALFAYSIRYIGYSYIPNPWLAFPFEALEVLTYKLSKVASSRYIGVHSPPGLLATFNGISVGLHYGFGRGCGSLIGGTLASHLESTALVFRYFGVYAAAAGLIYLLYHVFYIRCIVETDTVTISKGHVTEEDPKSEPFIELAPAHLNA